VTLPLVVIDADTLGRHRTGDETYVQNLLRELMRLGPPFRLAAVVRDAGRCPSGVEPLVIAGTSQVLRMAIRLPRLLNAIGPSLIHVQYVAPLLARGPVVVTVHDLSFERHPDLMGVRDRVLFRSLVPLTVRRADRVLVGSQWTKRDLMDRYGVRDDKIVVTPYGVDAIFHPDGSPPAQRPYLLFVGVLSPRKDPVAAIEALALLPDDLRLLFAGPIKRSARVVREAVRRLRLESRVEILGYVENERLADLYRRASCLVLPSRYEGFGLPVLEAMASGTPVVATTAGALPEIAGDAAVLVEPGDPAALASGIARVLAQRERFVAAGLERSRRFTWTETARRTLAAYQELL
jgi:glycosyltransferase involved in cell wall biosynthesis